MSSVGVGVTIDGQSKGAQSAIAQVQSAMSSLHDSAATGRSTLSDYNITWSTLGQSILGNLGPMGSWLVVAGSIMNLAMPLIDVFGGLAESVLSFAGSLVSDAMQQGVQEIENLTEQVFQLNEATEKMTGSWRFLFSTGGGPSPQNAQSLMNWTSQFSMQIPYTRQDLMGAITTLGRLNMPMGKVEQYMPLLADLGTLNPNLNLQQVAMAIQAASEGYSRMLRYDLGINPADLKKYGLDITGIGHISNPDQLLPALQKYANARGLTGSSKWAATNTFWGAESSFVDRLQNFGLAVGGTDLSGKVTKGTLFGEAKDDLTAISAWLDQHGPQLKDIANVFSSVLGGGAKDAKALFEGIFGGLEKSGASQEILGALRDFGQWLSQPSVQAGLQKIGDIFGALAGGGASTAFQGLQGFLNGLGQSGALAAVLGDVQAWGQWLSDPAHQLALKNMATIIGNVLGQAIVLASNYMRQLLLQFDTFFKVSGDLWQIATNPPGSPQWVTAMGQFTQDWTSYQQQQKQIQQQTAQEQAQWQQILNSMNGTTPSTGGKKQTGKGGTHHGSGGTTKTTTSGPPGGALASSASIVASSHITKAQKAAAAAVAAAVTGNDLTHQSGKKAAQAYIAGAMAEVQKSPVGQQFAQTFVTQMDTQLKQASGALATTLDGHIRTVVQQAVTQALQHMDFTSGQLVQQPGSWSTGVYRGYH